MLTIDNIMKIGKLFSKSTVVDLKKTTISLCKRDSGSMYYNDKKDTWIIKVSKDMPFDQ